MTAILGISGYYHDSAACLLINGEIAAAAQEERFTRVRHDARFPKSAVEWCLNYAGLCGRDLDHVVFYDKPLKKLERLIETYVDYVPRGFSSFRKSMPLWFGERTQMREEIARLCDFPGQVLFTEHHEAHAASAFFPSPFERAAVLTVDGVGEWATAAMGYGRSNQLYTLAEQNFPHSLGLLYSAFTYYTGFRVNSGEYKVMGLAPYGQPRFVQQILNELIDLKQDGSLRLNLDYFQFCEGLTMTGPKFHKLFGGPPRQPESLLTQREMDLARSIQEVTELAMVRMARHVRKETGERNLVLAGGVALNCVANRKVLDASGFEQVWIQPASGDAGGSLGAAFSVWHQYLDKPRNFSSAGRDRMQGALLGPEFGSAQVEAALGQLDGVADFRRLDRADLIDQTARLLAEGKIVGWFQGRMEFGPRALGARSILGDPRSPEMQSRMNLKIKFRESFRPFAPSVLAEEASRYFDIEAPSPYMLLVAPVAEHLRIPTTEQQDALFGIDKLNVPRSEIPAVTHVDYTARLQTVERDDNPIYYDLIAAFGRRTGCPVVVNTSFNVRGEPIVCTPEDAVRCFLRTNIDVLVMGDYLAQKTEAAEMVPGAWQEEFQLD
ncbi:MAG: carbamoyltransferase [Bryobacteraceae bacterium]